MQNESALRSSCSVDLAACVLWLWLIVDVAFDVSLSPSTAIVVGIGKMWRDFVVLILTVPQNLRQMTKFYIKISTGFLCFCAESVKCVGLQTDQCNTQPMVGAGPCPQCLWGHTCHVARTPVHTASGVSRLAGQANLPHKWF